MSAPPLYLFVHLPKTGGTTINGHLARHLEWDRVFVHLGPWGDRRRSASGSPDPSEWPPEAWNGVRVIAGHAVDGSTATSLAPGREARYFTVLREPAHRLLSLYNFVVSRTGDETGFWEWYARRSPNPVTRRLRKTMGVDSAAGVREALERFWFVGITEHLDDDLPHLFSAMGVPTSWKNRRVTGGADDLDDLDMGREMYPLHRHLEPTAEMLDRLREENARDVRLYEFARKLRTRRRRSLGWE